MIVLKNYTRFEKIRNIYVFVIIVESKVESLESIVGIGISTQRGSFTTWNSKDGRHYHKWVWQSGSLFVSIIPIWTMRLFYRMFQFYYMERSTCWQFGERMELVDNNENIENGIEDFIHFLKEQTIPWNERF